MSNLSKNKFIKVVLLVALFSHLSFFHEYFQNYVVCYEVDGHIQIENINECEECNTLNLFTSTANNEIIHNTDCTDIPLDNNCLQEEQLVRKNNIVISKNILQSSKTTIDINRNIICHTNEFQLKTNYILDNYSTVSLTI